MKSILLPILLLITFSTYAQNHFIGIVAGTSWMSVGGKANYFKDTNARSELTFGISYENRLKQNFLIGADLMYYRKGFSNDILYVDDDGTIS